ncbi:DUF134 domain-containing protein [Candidatus Woesearchaeota archaeon]|nr:DUF134 domain-containing protein [Candidatus Woesearchaeota archaeon]
MPRPRRKRRIRGAPRSDHFKPAGIPLQQLETVTLTLEEFEAIRLIDLEGHTQELAGAQMRTSQATLSRTLNTARKKIADALINGKAISINDHAQQTINRTDAPTTAKG